MESWLQKLDQREKELNETLVHDLEQRTTPLIHQIQDQLFLDIKYKIQNTQEDCHELVELVQFMNVDLSNPISKKVRKLDAMRLRVEQVLKVIDHFIDVKNCLEGVDDALKLDQMEKAANYVSKVLSQQQLENNSSSLRSPTTPSDTNSSNKAIYETVEKVKQNLKSKLQQSAEAKDAKNLHRLLPLVSSLDMEFEGLDLYCEFLEKILIHELETFVVDHLSAEEQDATFLELLTQVLDTMAACIEEQEPIVQGYFPNFNFKNSLGYLIRRLQKKVADPIATKILVKCIEKRKTGEIADKLRRGVLLSRELQKKNQPHSSHSRTQSETVDQELLDPRNIDFLLEELSLISSRCEIYGRFLQSKIVLENSEKKRDFLLQYTEMLTEKNGLFLKVQELMSYYITLDDHFLRESINKAITLNQTKKSFSKSNAGVNYFVAENETEQDDYFKSDSESSEDHTTSKKRNIEEEEEEDELDDPFLSKYEDEDEVEVEDEDKCSSLIDDTFFLLQKSLHRALSGYSIQVISAIANHINLLLSDVLLPELAKPLQVYHNSYNLYQRAVVLIALNNVDIAKKYIEKLKTEFEKNFENVVTTQQDLERLKSSSSDWMQTMHRYDEWLKSQTKKLFLMQFDHQIVKLFDNWKHQQTISFSEMTEAQLQFFETNDPFVKSIFVPRFEEWIVNYEKILTKDVYEMIVQDAASLVCQRLEKFVDDKGKFNQFGAFQLDRDIRAFLAYFSSKSHTTVRDKFIRLLQISKVLNLSKVFEIKEYYSSSGGSIWKISNSEIKKYLRMRTEFKKEDIERLKL